MTKSDLLNLLQERIVILDGGMGTMIQGFKLTEADYRGTRFADWPSDLKGNNDLLCITQPEVIQSIHRQYLDAGADIFATNTFNANAVSMEDYGMEHLVKEINIAAARLSRELADSYMAEHPERKIFVAGSIGPTKKTASMSPDVSDPAFRAITYMDLYAAYKEQTEAFIAGGVDIILFETTFDTLNVKAGLLQWFLLWMHFPLLRIYRFVQILSIALHLIMYPRAMCLLSLITRCTLYLYLQ